MKKRWDLGHFSAWDEVISGPAHGVSWLGTLLESWRDGHFW